MSHQPTDEELSRGHRWFAVTANNRAWQLAELPSRTEAEDDEMLNAAHAAAMHWATFANPLNDARARMLVAHAHAFVGNGRYALRHARASHAYLTSIDSPDWEIAFSHAVMAHAAAAANDQDGHRRHYAAARAAGDAIAGAEDRSIFEATFARIPAP
jgi:hypothetical protein